MSYFDGSLFNFGRKVVLDGNEGDCKRLLMMVAKRMNGEAGLE